MKPELVLNLKSGDKPEEKLKEWLDAYSYYATECLDTEDLAEKLSDRAQKACELIIARNAPDISSSHDEACYEEVNRIQNAEDAELDGDFPLGNAEDAEFAGTYFPIADLVGIQLGKTPLIDCGYYTEYNYAVLARKGFLAEQRGEWLEAARCYEGVSGSETVQNREYMCRRKAKAEGERLYALAQTHMENGEWSDVFYLLECATDMGNLEAETDLGLARAYGQFGAYKDTEEALSHLRHAANGGCARAAFEICELYDSGAPVDVHEAADMCAKAADDGMEKALIRFGDGFDFRPAREILQEQINNGDIEAIWQMSVLCDAEDDYAGYREWFDKAVEAGHPKALLQIAHMYLEKKSFTGYNPEMAKRYYRRAADLGEAEAIIALGDLELKDTDISFWDMAIQMNRDENSVAPPKKPIKEQHEKQFAWYELAAQSGDTGAIQAVANSYALGYPVEQNYEKAFMLASRGADEGDTVCMYMVAYFYENGFGVDKDADAAILFYTQAADGGVMSAILRLYEIYAKGTEDIPADPQKAAHYLFLSGEGRD